MNTFNIVTGPVRSGKSHFVRRHALEQDIIIDQLSESCIVIDSSKSNVVYWIVLDPCEVNQNSLSQQLKRYGQVNSIIIGKIENDTCSSHAIMTIKLIPEHTISNCYECIDYIRNIPTGLYYCRKKKEYTNNVGIPSWCPLEDL